MKLNILTGLGCFIFCLPCLSAKSQWTMGIAMPIASLSPFTMTGWDTVRVIRQSVESLALLDWKTDELVPALAESWDLAPDKKSFRVKLRKGVLFHDGTEMTSDDVVFSLSAYRDEKYGGTTWKPMWSKIKSVSPLNKHEVNVEFLESSYGQFVTFLTQLPILPKKVYENLPAQKIAKTLVGSGPYKLRKFEPNKQIVFEKNPNWWNSNSIDRAKSRDLIVKTVRDTNVALTILGKQEIDFWLLKDVASYIDLKKQKITKFKLRELEGLGGTNLKIGANLSHPVLKDRAVRRAMWLAWNRPLLNEKMFGGSLQLALDVFDPSKGFYPIGKPTLPDTKKALEILHASGWTDSDKDGVLDKLIDGKKTPLKFSIIFQEPEIERWVTMLQSDLKNLGVVIEIERIVEDSQSWIRLKEKRFELWATAGIAWDSPGQSFKTEHYYNFYGYSNPEVDKLLEKIESEFDLEKRRKIQINLIELIRADQFVIPGLVTTKSFFALSPEVNLHPKWPFQPIYWSE